MTTQAHSGKFSIIVAATQTGGIGLNGKIPWHIPGDLKRFKNMTCTAPKNKQNVVIMGRKTWESIPPKYQPLPRRINIVITSGQTRTTRKCITASTFNDALALTAEFKNVNKIWCIGGGRVYAEAISSPMCESIYYTLILGPKAPYCDTYFPQICPNGPYSITLGKVHMDPIPHQFNVYTRMLHKAIGHEEQQFLDLVQKVLMHGNRRIDRTKIGTLAIFGAQCRYTLRGNIIPLLTTKKVPFSLILKELLWIIRGQTDSKILAAQNCHIWDANGTRAFLDQCGHTSREEGDLGPIYGFQWRHWGAQYRRCDTDYKGQGIDQLHNLIKSIKKNPFGRRHIISAWNVGDLSKMALPPCHMICQFFVSDGELSCHLYQRSCDLGLGVPFNIASYSILTHMVAHVCGLGLGELIHTMGDTHIYLNHVQQLNKLISRRPAGFPKLAIVRKVADIGDFQLGDFKLSGYKPASAIKMAMAV